MTQLLPDATTHRPANALPGLLLAVAVAVVATIIGLAFPVVGAPVSGIAIGVGLAASVGRRDTTRAALAPGTKLASTWVLQCSVVVLGAQLSLGKIASVGLASLPVMIGTLAMCLSAAWVIGRRLGIVGDLRTLIGVGTGICGASAIAAATPVIGAVGADVAYAISTIFVFNIAAVLTFPLLGHLLGMSQHGFGLFAGTAVNDMSSVVAAASTYGHGAADYAVVVKLVRTLMIIPVCIGLAALTGRRTPQRERVRPAQLVPWFLVGFLIVAAANSAHLIPVAAHPDLRMLATFLITVALAGIGLSTDLAALRRAGLRPLLLGGSLWVVVSLTSLGLQWVSGLA